MNKVESTTQSETAFGRGPTWLGGLPAVFVGGSAFLMAVYGTFLLPAKLPLQYRSALDTARNDYSTAIGGNGASSLSDLGDAAGEVDVVYARLVGLEKGDPNRYWEWAEFEEEHARNLRNVVEDPAASLTDEARTDLVDQANQFEDKARKTFGLLAAGDSPIAAKAIVWVAKDEYRRGMESGGVGNAQELMRKLETVLERSALGSEPKAQASGSGNGNAIDEGRNEDWIDEGEVKLLLVQLAVEAAWYVEDEWRKDDASAENETERQTAAEAASGNGKSGEAGRVLSLLDFNSTQLVYAASLWKQYATDELRQSEWLAVGTLLNALDGKVLTNADIDAFETGGTSRIEDVAEVVKTFGESNTVETLDEFRYRDDSKAVETLDEFRYEKDASYGGKVRWTERLAEVQVACIDGDWEDAAFLLARQNTDSDLAVRMGAARTICRLARSDLAQRNATWAEGFANGLQVSSQLAPFMPEFSELVWQCAVGQSKTKLASSDVPDAVVAGIASSSNGPLKHSVFALAAAMQGQTDVAKTHMQLIQRSGGSQTLISRTALWYTQTQAAGTQADAPQVSESAQGGLMLHLEGLLRVATELEPENGLHWFALGVAQRQLGETQAAVASLEKAQELLGEVPVIAEMLGEWGKDE